MMLVTMCVHFHGLVGQPQTVYDGQLKYSNLVVKWPHTQSTDPLLLAKRYFSKAHLQKMVLFCFKILKVYRIRCEQLEKEAVTCRSQYTFSMIQLLQAV